MLRPTAGLINARLITILAEIVVIVSIARTDIMVRIVLMMSQGANMFLQCGPGSAIDIHVACTSDSKTARWAYYCASENKIRFKDIPGPTCSSSSGGGGRGGLACSVPTGELPPYNCDPPDIPCTRRTLGAGGACVFATLAPSS